MHEHLHPSDRSQMMINRQSATLNALGRIEGFKNDLRMIRTQLEAAPLWLPGIPLKTQCDQAVHMIEDIAERFERKLVVTLVGPCGAGKSTLLNVLAGVDTLSEVGHRRPTTGHLIVFGSAESETDRLAETLGREAVEFRSSPEAVFLEHLLLIDTPDTDSRAYRKHIPIVRKAIAHSDMLICVFDAENPKRRDHIDFLASYVRMFNGDSLVAVINKCDRLDEQELKNQILPDFLSYIRSAWEGAVDRVLCISARRHLQRPQWDETAGPKHDFDQFGDLQKLVFDTLDRAGYVVDRRLENAKSLRNWVAGEVQREISKAEPVLTTAEAQMKSAEKKAAMDALLAMRHEKSGLFFGVNLLVYQKLAQLWVGPMGWLIAFWARMLIFGSGIVALFRFGHPLRQMFGMVSALRHFGDRKAVADDLDRDRRMDAVLRKYRLVIRQHWPDVAEALIQGGFDSTVRRVEEALSATDIFGEQLSSVWLETLDGEIERVSRRLSGILPQFLFNVPVVGILGYTGWQTLREFFSGSYLSGDFFVHAIWTIAIILLVSFFVLQVCIRFAARTERVTAKAFEKMEKQLEDIEAPALNPIRSQLDTILWLAAISGSGKDTK